MEITNKLMNAHHAPLNNDHRYWVGLLLLVKLVYFLLSTLFYANIETVGIFSACLAFMDVLQKELDEIVVDWTMLGNRDILRLLVESLRSYSTYLNYMVIHYTFITVYTHNDS